MFRSGYGTMKKRALAIERLHAVLNYDSATGIFTWKQRTSESARCVQIGSIAGGLTAYDGYRRIKIDGFQYLEHVLAWVFVHDRWPAHQIDHINTNRSDNRLANLREATKSQNAANARLFRNNTSGRKGVYRHGDKWQAVAIKDRRRYNLGTFSTRDEAYAVYVGFASHLHGEFFNSGTGEAS